MINYILDHWVEEFTERLKDDTSDALKANFIEKDPYQRDPVRDAPYIHIGIGEKGIEPEGLAEIGGSSWWVAHLTIKAAPKSQKTKERAYYLADLLGQRILWILRNESLTIVLAPQGTGRLFNRDRGVIERIYPKVYGGEGEWLSYVEVTFFQRIREVGPAPYGAFPGDIE